ncbi:MAG TPA: DUF4430 domain-containing protein [Gaiellaceae bacterium]|nr:DUF4430 domain-containing protein [Gaiellaceae bacterium]
MIRSALVVTAAAALLAGCGGGTGGGKATLWVTRDEGKHLLLVRTVPAGETAMQALARSTKLSTRYGGRFVESIDGLAGSAGARHDWFYFVNGIEADRGAAEYVLHPGDVEWWDYRDWGRVGESVPVVVGAFPEPFVHGYAGTVRPAVVVGADTAAARSLARLVHGKVGVSAPPGANVLRLEGGPARFTARKLPGGAVELVYSGDAAALARDPSLYRYRYAVP